MNNYIPQILNTLLRLLPMVAKLCLTFYMGRYYSLESMGIYGLVFGAVMLLSPLLGQGFGYIVLRDIVGADSISVLHKLRDQVVWYGINYLVMAVIIFVLTTAQVSHISAKILWMLLVLTILEGFGGIAYYSMNVLQQQIWANVVFCIRSALWIFPVIALGLLFPFLRTVDVILCGWILGGAVSLVTTFYLWRHMPWLEALRRPIDWPWIVNGVKRSSLIWLGAIGLAGGTYIDRFVVERFLSLSDVGVITFYSSFTNSLLALLESGILVFATPLLIKYHSEGLINRFHYESRRAMRQMTLGALIGALLLGMAVLVLARYTNHASLLDEAQVLWLMLSGACIRALSEVFKAMLYAKHHDRPIWRGNILFLIPAIGGNVLLVPLCGIDGIGITAILAASWLYIWRWWYVRRPGGALAFAGLP